MGIVEKMKDQTPIEESIISYTLCTFILITNLKFLRECCDMLLCPFLYTEISKFQGGMDLPKVIKLISVRSKN